MMAAAAAFASPGDDVAIEVCGVCFHKQTDARLLVCLHSFCRDCVDQLSVTEDNGTVVRCPLCKHVSNLPDNRERPDCRKILLTTKQTHLPHQDWTLAACVKTGRFPLPLHFGVRSVMLRCVMNTSLDTSGCPTKVVNMSMDLNLGARADLENLIC